MKASSLSTTTLEQLFAPRATFSKRLNAHGERWARTVNRSSAWLLPALIPIHFGVRWHINLHLLGPVGPVCTDMARIGGDPSSDSRDGEKAICGLARLRSPCTVISLGSFNDFSFENDVLKHTPCHVATYDCTVKQPRPPVHERMRYHSYCIGRDTGGRLHPMIDYVAALRLAGLAPGARPAYLKMDVEGSEWAVLPEMLRANRHLLPDQLSLELHPPPADYGGKPEPMASAMLMDSLWQLGGYFVADRVDSVAGTDCTELLLVRRHAVLESPTAFVPSPEPPRSLLVETLGYLWQMVADRLFHGGRHHRQLLKQHV